MARHALAIWHRLLCMACPALLGWVSLRINFGLLFRDYLHITYKTLNKTN